MSTELSSAPAPAPASAPRNRRVRCIIGWACLALIVVIGVRVLWTLQGEGFRGGQPERVDGRTQTVMVPTLETPLPKSKSAIWCATLPLAWQQLEKQVAGGPVDLEGAEGMSRAMREMPDPGLDRADYYAAAGFCKDGILERIRREFPLKFRASLLPAAPPNSETAILAYACLKVSLGYEYEFNHEASYLPFTDSRGKKSPVRAIGILPEDKGHGFQTYRGQVRFLFSDGDDFAIDLSRNTRPYQIVLARMGRRTTLKATLQDLERRIAAADGHRERIGLGPADWLLVPVMDWQCQCHFHQMEGKKLSGSTMPPGASLDRAAQLVKFKMNHREAKVIAEAILGADWSDGDDDEPRGVGFLFDRPYLIVLKRRGAEQPFFVMWVDNTELMQPPV